MEIKIALFPEFATDRVDDSLIVLNKPVCFNTRIGLVLEVIVFDFVVY